MFIFEKKTVKIIEYSSQEVRKPRIPLKQINTNLLTFDVLKLAFSLARSMVSKNPGNIKLVLQAWIAFEELQLMLMPSSTNIQFSVYAYILRDNLFSTFTGKLAQGLVYILSQEHLKYEKIFDFRQYLLSQNIQLPKNKIKTPDYVLTNDFKTISLIESKGSASQTSVKTGLRYGLEQCDSGHRYIQNQFHSSPVSHKFAAHVQFDKTTTVHYCDPSEPPSHETPKPDSFFRYYYSSWFGLFGYFDTVTKLRNNQEITSISGELREINGYKYRFFRSKSTSIFQAFPLMFKRQFDLMEFGVLEEIYDFLIGKTANMPAKLDLNTTSDNYKLFTDGIAIHIPRNNLIQRRDFIN